MVTKRVWIGFMVIVLLCTFTFTKVYGADTLLSADDDEFEDDVDARPATPRPGVPLFPEKKPASKTLQQADDIYDADEFEGIEAVKHVEQQPEPEEEETPEPEIKITPKDRFGILEMSYITFITVLIANYFVGKRANEKIATTWGTHFQNLFSANFAKFGEAQRFIITKESASVFSVTASGGRARCAGAVFTLDLNKRHDLTSYVLGIFSPHKDTLTVDVAMQPNQPFCFALGKKKEEKQLLKNYKETVAAFALAMKMPARLANYAAHTDSPEISDDIFKREIVEILANNEQYFSSVAYTDLSPQYIGHKTILRIVYRLPPAKDMAKLADLMRCAFLFIDAFAAVQLTKSTLQKNEAARKKVVAPEKTAHEIRQENAQKKKLEKQAAERAAYEKMSPEAQRKYEEKEEKRKLKAKQSKVKVVYS